MDKAGITVVIPAYNEEKFLPATLAAANLARKNFESAFGLPSEVIVVNNASTDQTGAVTAEYGGRSILEPLRNISAVRNAGIKQASYSLVVAIDADSFLPPQALVKVWELMSAGNHIGGAFGVKVITNKWVTRLGAPIVQAIVARLSGIYGGMFFFWKASALEMGGFPEDRLIAEDTAFAIALRKHGCAQGKKFACLKSVQVETLDRKEVDPGTILRVAYQVVRAVTGVKQTTEELDYWYKPNR